MDLTEARFRALIEHAPIAIGLSRDGITLYANYAYLKMFGFVHLDEIIGKPIGDHWSPEARVLIAEHAHQRSQGFPAPTEYEAIALTKRGSQFPVQITVTIVELPDGPAAVAFITDLTERKRAEAALRQRNRYIETVLEEAPIGFAVHTIDDGVGRFVSARYEEIYGVPRGSIDSHHKFFEKVWPYDPDLREQIRRRVVADMTSGDASRMHWENVPVRTADGRTRYINAMNIPVPDQNLMVSTVQDVTENVRAQEALHESEERWRLAAGAAGIGAYSYDFGNGQMFRSPEHLALYGLPACASLKLDEDQVPEAVHPDDKAGLLAHMAGCADPRSSGILEFEHRIIRADGQIRWLRVQGRTTFSDDGRPLRSDGIVQDITERRHIVEALRTSEERFRQVTETVSDFVWEVDANGLYTYTSPAVARIMGYTPDELVGKLHFYDLFAPEVREQLKTAAFHTFAARQRFQAFPHSNLSKSGEIVHFETSGVPILDDADHLLGYRGADTDVTSQRRAEMETQILRQQLSHFSRVATITELTTSIAHEINQPLAAILCNAQAALRLIQDPVPDLEELHEILADIVSADERAAEVIRSMRSMLKKGGSARHPISLNDLIRDVVPVVRNDALIKDVSVALDLGSPIPPVNGNRIQLQQVVLNLAVNALEAMEASKRPRKLSLRTRQVEGEVLLDISDSGAGIPSDKLASVFEPFFTTKANGLGLGLPLSRSIVTAHEGRLWAENNAEGGATFHMALPTAELSLRSLQEAGLNAEIQKPDPSVPVPSTDPGRKIRVLLADDHIIVRQGIARLLSNETDIEIVGEAADGQEAIKLTFKLLPDIILMDLNMPGLNGIEATRIIHSEHPGICIIGLSISEETEKIQAMRAAGAVDYRTKSGSTEALINAIRTNTNASSKAPSTKTS